MIILSTTLIILAAISEASMDILDHKYYSSVFAIEKLNPYWFDPLVSWENKYKNRNHRQGPKFFGSTTFLVFTTDAWHFFKWMKNLCIWIGIPILVLQFDLWWHILVAVVLARIVYGAIFELFYKKILMK